MEVEQERETGCPVGVGLCRRPRHRNIQVDIGWCRCTPVGGGSDPTRVVWGPSGSVVGGGCLGDSEEDPQRQGWGAGVPRG